MRLWEITGSLLVLIGLYLFYQIFDLVVNDSRPVEGGALTLIGIVVFRGGIHLLKVSAAAQACREYEAQLRQAPKADLSFRAHPTGAKR